MIKIFQKYYRLFVCGILLFLSGIGVLCLDTQAYAQSFQPHTTSYLFGTSRFASPDTTDVSVTDTPTDTPTETPTNTSTPTSTPTNTPTPTPTSKSTPPPPPTPTPTPTQPPIKSTLPVQATPTTGSFIPPVQGTATTPVPSATPQPSPTLTPSVSTTPTTNSNSTLPDSTDDSSNSQQANTMKAGLGSSLLLPIGAVVIILLLAGGGLIFLLFHKQPASATPMVAQSLPQSHTPSLTLNSYQTPETLLSGSPNEATLAVTPAIPPINPSLLAEPSTMASMAPMTQRMDTNLQQPSPFATINQTYMPTDLQPITAAQIPVAPPNMKNSAPAKDMRPLSLDSLDFATVLEQVDKGQSLPNLFQPSDSTTQAAQYLMQSPQAPDPVITNAPLQNIVLPDIQGDPILETIMRQAQMGLYAAPIRNHDDPNEAEEELF